MRTLSTAGTTFQIAQYSLKKNEDMLACYVSMSSRMLQAKRYSTDLVGNRFARGNRFVYDSILTSCPRNALELKDTTCSSKVSYVVTYVHSFCLRETKIPSYQFRHVNTLTGNVNSTHILINLESSSVAPFSS